jgi:hypothetical protein
VTSAGSVKDAVGNPLSGLPDNGPSYVIDKTAPPAPGLISKPPAFSSSTSATFRFAVDDDNDGDTGEGDADDMAGITLYCSRDGAAFTVCTSPLTYNGLAQGSHTFRVYAVDQAGNQSPTTSYSWFVDTVAPTVTFTQTPPNPDTNTSPTFRFSASDASPSSGIAYIQCKLDSGSWQTCTSPRQLNNLALGTHTFSIRAYDNAGNVSSIVPYTWQINAAGGMPFTISGDLSPLLYPGAAAQPLNLSFQNPNSVPITITDVSIVVAHTTNKAGCDGPTNLKLANADASPPAPTPGTRFTFPVAVVIPAGTTKSLQQLAIPTADWPALQMPDAGNQDPCQKAVFSLTYTGNAHS